MCHVLRRHRRLDENVEFLEEHARLRRECGVVGEEVDGEVVIGLAREQVEVDVAGEFLAVALLVAIDRGFIGRSEGVARLTKIVDYLTKADRFHGVWPHWLNGPTLSAGSGFFSG